MTQAKKIVPLAAKSRGRRARKEAPRSSHSWTLENPARRDPVAILLAQAATRVPELVPIRHGRMLQSPFAFYRGAAAIMARDLAQTPTTGLTVQLCGDAHLANFGGFSAPDRHLVFDVNDFDETLPGPFEWDIKRLAASLAVAGRAVTFTTSQRAAIIAAAVSSYQEAMRGFAAMTRLEVWYARLDVPELLARWRATVDARTVLGARRTIKKAGKRTSARAFSRYTTLGSDGALHPISDPPLVVPLEELFSGDLLAAAHIVVAESLRAYIASLTNDKQHLVNGYELVGVARKVVGVGSVGTRCWIALLTASDDPHDDLVLQVKEAGPSVLEPHLAPSEFTHGGQRVVEGQRLMQAASDTLLGWESSVGADGQVHDFYVRQMWDGKVSADFTTMHSPQLQTYAQMCGWTLARAHARTGDRKAITAYLGSNMVFADAIVRFAESYADQNTLDFAAVQRAAAEGVIEVATG